MSNNIFVNSIRVVDERESGFSRGNSVVNFYGEVIVQASNEEKNVIIEYTTDSWNRENSVTAKRLHTLSSNQELYYFEISVFKESNLPLYLEFRARCKFANYFYCTDEFDFLYDNDEGTPREKFFSNNNMIEINSTDVTLQNNSAEEGLGLLEEGRRYLEEEELRRLEEERRNLEEERRQYEEALRQSQQEEERRNLENERRQYEEALKQSQQEEVLRMQEEERM
ncbi:14428_t:CDS:1, partial [Gigaspora rosea]